MNEYGYNSFKIKLREGERHPFLVVSKVILQDQKEYLILEDENSQKHFLPAEFYKSYRIEIGSTIQCVIDKINCTGRIFLEPVHPYYMTGKTYEFKLKRIHGIFDEPDSVYHDPMGNYFIISASKSTLTDEFVVSGKIQSIKKGLIEIEILK